MDNKEYKLKYRKKVTIIFIEYFVFALFFMQTFNFLNYALDLKEFSNFFMILFICYFIYFSLFEFFMKKSLIMWLFKIELDKEKKVEYSFLIIRYIINSGQNYIYSISYVVSYIEL